jgi:hypothetical protein
MNSNPSRWFCVMLEASVFDHGWKWTVLTKTKERKWDQPWKQAPWEWAHVKANIILTWPNKPSFFSFFFETSLLKCVWPSLRPHIIKTTHIDILCWNTSSLCWVPQTYSHVLSSVKKTHKIYQYLAQALHVIFTSSNHRFYVIIKRVSTNIAMTCGKIGGEQIGGYEEPSMVLKTKTMHIWKKIILHTSSFDSQHVLWLGMLIEKRILKEAHVHNNHHWEG